MSRFNRLDIPPQWEHYWTRYPNGYSILEALISWVNQVNDMVDLVNNWDDFLRDFQKTFEFELQQEVGNLLTEWFNDGTLADIINNDVFNMKADKIELEKTNAALSRQAQQLTFGSRAEYIGHRGMEHTAPENTMPSYYAALQAGFTSLEGDVSFTSDGYQVMLHDSSVDRTTNGSGSVTSMTYSQVRALDASNSMDFYAGTKIPSFDELLELCKANGAYCYPEMKNLRSDNDARLIVDKVMAHNMLERTVLQSFTLSYLQTARSHNPYIQLGCLAQDASVFSSRLAFAKSDPNACLIVSASVLTAESGLVKDARDSGIELIAYGVSNSRIIQDLQNVGVYRYIVSDNIKAVG